MADGLPSPTENGRVVPTDVSLQFTSIPNCLTCEPVTFEWNYSGNPDLELKLAVTNVDIPELSEDTPILYQTIDTINGGELGTVSSFSWDKVNIPAGIYALEAWIAGISYMSSTFNVANGTDVSCLNDSPSPFPTGPTTSTGTGTATSSTPSATNTNNDLPVIGATGGNSGMSTGAIVGIVVAVIGLLGALMGAFLLFRYFRRRNAGRRPLSPTRARSGFFEKGPGSPKRGGARFVYGGERRGGFGGGGGGGGGGVVGGGAGAGMGAGTGFAGNRSSAHGHLNEYAYAKDNQSTRSYPGASDEDIASLSEEKMVTNAPSGGYDFITAADLPTLPSRYRNSTASLADSTGTGGGTSSSSLRPRLQTRNSDPFATPTTRVVQQLPVGMFDERLHTPVSPAFPQSVSASPASTRRRLSGESERSNLAGLGLGLGLGTQQLSPPSAPVNGKRTMSARKPVPVYSADLDDATLVHPSTTIVTTTASDAHSSETHELLVHSPTSHRTSGTLVGSSSLAPDHQHHHHHSSSSPSTSTSSHSNSTENDWSSTAQVSHAALTPSSHSPHSNTNSHSNSHLSPSPNISVPSSIGTTGLLADNSPVPRIPHPDLPELNHKSSFGDRPVHYLMPDPLPAPGVQVQSHVQGQSAVSPGQEHVVVGTTRKTTRTSTVPGQPPQRPPRRR